MSPQKLLGGRVVSMLDSTLLMASLIKSAKTKSMVLMDKISPAKRSWNMAQIKAKDTIPERLVRSMLHKMGFRFRLHRRDLPGTPDIVLPKWKVVIFVHGCFWHRHPGCKRTTMPASNTEYWKAKFMNNKKRDKSNQKQLTNLGWQVIIIWECELRQPELVGKKLSTLMVKRL